MKRRLLPDLFRRTNKKTMGAVPSSGLAPEATNSTAELFFVPLEVLEEIFLNLPSDKVVRVCRLVCKQWKEVADSESLWRERCRRERYKLEDTSKIPKDWRMFYFLRSKKRNLLKNPRAEDKFSDWKILENGGNQWAIEALMVPHPNEMIQKNFVTSYGMCKKSQLIDLESEGYNSSFMDRYQPHIKISDWYAPRWDCSCEYSISVELLNNKKKTVQKFAPQTINFPQWNNQQWNQITHVFKNYGPGVRFVSFIHGGKDGQFWAGWYGIRITDSCIEICSEVDT